MNMKNKNSLTFDEVNEIKWKRSIDENFKRLKEQMHFDMFKRYPEYDNEETKVERIHRIWTEQNIPQLEEDGSKAS
jgi:hypothetical protein